MRKPEIACARGVTVVTLGAEYERLDAAAIADLKIVRDLIDEIDPPKMVMNLKPALSMSSAFLEFLFEMNQRLRFQIDGEFGICNASPHCREILAVTKIDSVLELFPSCEEAIAAYSDENGNP